MCKRKKRILSLVLSLLMVFTMMPMPVSAAEVAEPEVKEAAAPEDTVETPEQATEEPAAETTNGLEQPEAPVDTVETPEQATEEPMVEPMAETTNGLEKPAVGDGTIENPYQIANADNLYWFAATVNGTDGLPQNALICAILTADITVNIGVLNEDGTLSENSENFRAWTPIGNDGTSYKGTFDGNGQTIKGMYVNTSTDFVGLVGTNEGTIQNVNVVDSYFNNTKNYTGGVCGDNWGTIENCTNSGSVSGTDKVGGVCGSNDSTITNCTNSGSVSGADYVGGVCGYNRINTSTIKNCTNRGSVSGVNYVAGVCGCNFNGTIESCTNSVSVNGTNNVGGVCGRNESTITNCTNSGSVSGTKYVGGVCGYNINNCTIENCINSGNVSGTNDVGGVCGRNDRIITNCTNSGSVSSTDDVGGVSGNNLGTITNCTNSGSVSGVQSVGGVCSNNYGSIMNCTNNGSVSGNYYVGGVNGYNENGSITNCSNSGSVSGQSWIGGVNGGNLGSITNCTNNGGVNGNASVGGVCGNNGDGGDMDVDGTITNCINSGNVIGVYYVGGVCATNGTGTMTNCYYLTKDNVEDLTAIAKTAEQFASGEVTYLLNDSKSTPAEGGTLAWYQNLNNGSAVDAYPVLDDTHGTVYQGDYFDENGFLVEGTYSYSNTQSSGGQYQKPAGEGTATNPYQIANAGNLYWFAATVNGTDGLTKKTDACATLAVDITVNTDVLNTDGTLNSNATNFRVWTPIGQSVSNSYDGTFDGAGYTIKGLYVNTSTPNVGLVGYNKGTIQNVNVADSYFKGGNDVGGVSGSNRGTITNCTNSGSVSGNYYVGGVCSSNYGSIMNCTNNGSVSGNYHVGGVNGYNENGSITNCSNSGSVSGQNWIGGVNGGNYGSITNCTNNGGVNGNAFVGGVCGNNDDGGAGNASVGGTITNCINSGSVSGTGAVGGVCGINGSGTMANCYYLTKDNVGDLTATSKTAEQFASGEVTYLLNDSKSTPAEGGTLAWYQNLGENGDPTPVLDSTHGVVYKNEHTNGDATYDNGIAYIVAATAKTVDGADVSVNLEGLKVYTKGTKATVSAPVNSGYNFVGWYVKSVETPYYTGNALSTNRTYTFTAEQDIDLVAVYQALGKVELTLGGNYNYTINGTSKSGATTEAYTLGTTITLATNGDKFAYWANAAGMILSRDKEYTFTVTGKDTITAEFDSVTSGTIVSFISFYNQVMNRSQWANAADITIPGAPTRYGYTFKCWSIGKTEYATEDELKVAIAAQIKSQTEKLTVTPVYTKKTASYTVTVNKGTGAGSYEVNTLVSVTANAAEEGMKFANWTDSTDKIVSYNETYQFYVIGNTTLTANFVAETTVVEEKGTTEIVDVVKDTTNGKITFVSMSTVPKGCTILKAGVIATADSTVGNSGDEFNKDTAAMVRGDAWSGNAYQYSLTIKSVKTVYVRAYLEYKDSEGNQIVVYGDMTKSNINE